jgi:hypothetical protein
MSIIDTEQFILPSDPTVIKQIKDAMQEISFSYTRTESEKDFVKEALAELSEATEIPKKHLAKIAKLHHKANKDQVEAEQSSTNDLYDRIFEVNQEEN